jgi:peptidoglycan hydrolase CwlO-like protein
VIIRFDTNPDNYLKDDYMHLIALLYRNFLVINGFHDRLDGVDKLIQDLDIRITKNEGDINDLDVRITKNESDINHLDVRITKNEGDISDLDIRITKNEGDIVDINNTI